MGQPPAKIYALSGADLNENQQRGSLMRPLSTSPEPLGHFGVKNEKNPDF